MAKMQTDNFKKEIFVVSHIDDDYFYFDSFGLVPDSGIWGS